MKGLKFLITLFVGATLSPISSLAQYSEMAARDNPQAQHRALAIRVGEQESRLIALEKELHTLRARMAQQTRIATTPAPAITAAPLSSTPGLQTYQVRTGDTLNSVARLHSVSVMELMAINDLRAPDRIQIGAELLIPTLRASPPSPQLKASAPAAYLPGKTTTYTVRTGDTIAAIAKAHGVTIQDIVSANGLPNANRISIGQPLIIAPGTAPAALTKTSAAAPPANPQPAAASTPPAPKPTAGNPFPSGYAYYTVVSGDNLYTIGKLFGTTQRALEELNKLKPNATIHPDQQIVVPMENYKGPFVSN